MASVNAAITRKRLPLRHVLVWAGVLALLATVFLAYLDPHLMVDLANRAWACF